MGLLVQLDVQLYLLCPPELELNMYLCIFLHEVLFAAKKLIANVWIRAEVPIVQQMESYD